MKTLAQDIMSTEILSVREGTPVEEALKLLVNSRITGLPVVNPEGKMVGICSDYDLITQLNATQPLRPEIFRAPLKYSTTVQAVDEKTPLEEIISMFVTSRFRRLPVTGKDGKLVGIITRRDIMKLFYYRVALS